MGMVTAGPDWPDSRWRADAPPGTFAPLADDRHADVVVIGAGYTGLNAALELAETHGRSVAVLDGAQPGWGASGRNGGFCCIGGSKLSDTALVRRFGAEGARAFHAFQRAAIDRVGDNLDRYGIDADRGPDGEAVMAHSVRAFAELTRGAEIRRALYGETVRMLAAPELADAGLGGRFAGAALTAHGFPLHPMRHVLGLAKAATAAGVSIHGDSRVTGIVPETGHWRVRTATGNVRAAQVLIAVNGYGADALTGWLGGRRLAALSAILTTRVLTDAERAAQNWTGQTMAYDTRRLLHYFRLLPDGRFLFGMRGGLSEGAGTQLRVARLIRHHFAALFPEWRDVETDRFWSGRVCLTASLTPFVGPVPGADGLFAAFGWHGNGVAAGTLGGRLAGGLVAGSGVTIPAVMRAPPPRFFLPSLRKVWQAEAYAAYGVADGPLPR